MPQYSETTETTYSDSPTRWEDFGPFPQIHYDKKTRRITVNEVVYASQEMLEIFYFD